MQHLVSRLVLAGPCMGLAVVASIVGPAEYVFVEAVAVVVVFVDVIAVFVEGLIGCVGCVPNVTKESF